MAETNDGKTIAKQPSFSFHIVTSEPPFIEEESSSNNSSMTSAATILSRQGSSSTSSAAHKRNISFLNMTHSIHFSLHKEPVLTNALMSELSSRFITQIKTLTDSRDIFCSAEYPTSFTGEEAVDIIAALANDGWARKDCRTLARSFMQADPPIFIPVAYSDKSIKHNTLYDSPKEAYTLVQQEAVDAGTMNGVVTSLTDCYTPMCIKGVSNGCYAPTCPNKGSQLLSKSNIVNKELQRNISLSSSVASSQDTFVSRCWSNTVSRETRQKTPIKEIKRQEAMCELIYTEEDYVRDLNLLDDLFAKPLLTAQCIEPERRASFCSQVFGNYLTITELHRQMYRELRDHQLTSLEDGGFVDALGNILLKYVDQFMQAYTDYAQHFIFAEYTAKQEMAHNMLFQNFIREKEKQAEMRKLPFRHFIILPITRLQRYPLLLDAIYKKTDDDVPEKQKLAQCIECVTKVAKEMDRLMLDAKQALRIRQIHDMIRFKPGYDKVDLDLLNPCRKLVYEGPLKRRSSNLIVDSVELHVFLFDHMLVMTKPAKKLQTIEAFTVSKKPIPLNLLMVEDVAENFIYSTFRSSTVKSPSTIPTAAATAAPQATIDASTQQQQQLINQSSLLIRHLGRHGGEYVLYAEKPSSRYIWKSKLQQAQTDLELKEQPSNVFKLSTVNDAAFNLSGNNGKVTCAAPFVGEGGRKMVALGTQQGVWMGKESGETNSFSRVLSVTDVSQIAVLPAQSILLVLADKVLTAYPLAQLDPYVKQDSKRKANATRVLSSNASYFNTGTCNGRTLVITMKRKGSDSHFKAHEPTCGDLKDPKNSKLLATKTSFMSKPPAWFKIYKEFYIGMDSTAVHFLKSKVLVACQRGYEVIDLERLNEVSTNFPDLNHRDYQFLVGDLPKPISIFRCNEKNFLLCYDRFAFRMTTHGDYVKDGYKRIEWESNPISVAFHYPYVLAFDSKFIEVRHAETGQLVQIIRGNNTRYLPSAINNTNATSTAIYCSATHQFKPENQFIFKLEPICR